MTVRENLDLGAYRRRGPEIAEDLDRVFDAVPAAARSARSQKAGTMSGGEQQMLAIGRALMARPEAADARRAVDGDRPDPGRSGSTRRSARSTAPGSTILLVEQNANYALDVSSRGYVLETGPGRAGQRLGEPARRPRGPEGVPGDMTGYGSDRLIGVERAVPAVRLADLGGGRGVAGRAQGLRRAGRADVRPDPVGPGLLIVLLLPGAARVEVAGRRPLPRRRRPPVSPPPA